MLMQKNVNNDFSKDSPIVTKYQPRSQGLSSLPPLVVGTETLVAAGHVTIYPSKTAGWVGTQVHLVETKTLLPLPSSKFFFHSRLREAEKRDPGNEVDEIQRDTVIKTRHRSIAIWRWHSQRMNFRKGSGFKHTLIAPYHYRSTKRNVLVKPL